MAYGDYTLERVGDKLVLSTQYIGHEKLMDQSGVMLVNNQLKKEFPTSRFKCEPEEFKTAWMLFLVQCEIVLGMSGYTDVSEPRCRDLGIPFGHYEGSLSGLMNRAIKKLRNRTPGIRPGIVYGSASYGVDFAISETAKEGNIPIIGTSCLPYLWYVDNCADGPTVLIVPSEDDYCRLYVSQLHILLAANGGEASYRMDIHAATEALIPVIPVDVLGMLGARITPFIIDASGKRKVNDAVAALNFTWRLLNWQPIGHSLAQDRFHDIANLFSNAVVARARELAPGIHAYR